MTAIRLPNIHSCRKFVRSLQLDPYATAYELCDQISSLRARPIRVVESRLPIPGPMGVWVCRAHDDVVVVQELATGAHHDHIVLHELAHILCEHEGETFPEYEPVLPILDQERDGGAVLRLRSAYDSETEREAELLAAAFAEQMTDDRTEPGISWDVHRYFAGD
ncbi:hypothetical protein AB0I54_06760 [Streptomyces sp. NPDC050625]|uniref:hypothetical protein n=1 Tax=Streptomyces sp. NPDC050625 TaxID=3154629 RepID=UPI003431E591